MIANERTSLLQNGNGVFKHKDKLIIPMPKDPIFTFEVYWDALSLEQLLPYQDEPWWQRLRSTLLYSFWLMVLLTFVAACAMAYFHSDSSCKAVKTVSTSSSQFIVDSIASSTLLSEILGGAKLAT